MSVQHLNNALRRSRAVAERHLPELEATYTTLLRTAGRAAAHSFGQQTSITAAVRPWEPPPDDLVDGATLEQDAQAKLKAQYVAILKAVTPADDLGISWDISHATPQALLASIAQRLGTLGDAIREQVKESIQAGYENGWSVAKTASAIIERVDSVAPGRAAALARTDLNALSNGASLAMASQVDGVNSKTWLATDDERTRETHAEADGQTVPIDQPFTVGGEQADYPGDPDLSDEESFNCRCTVIYGEPLTAASTAEGGEMNDQSMTAAASGDTSLPLSARDRAWDAGAATARLKKWASSDGSGDPDTIDYAKLARGYFWKDGTPAAIGDLKLPFADLINGTLTAVWRGVTAGAQRLTQTQGVDVGAVQKKMAAFYVKAAKEYNDPSIKPPWGADGSHGANALRLSALRGAFPGLADLSDDQVLAVHAMTLAARSKHRYAGDGAECAICGEQPSNKDAHYQALTAGITEFTIIAAAAPGEPTRWVAPAIAVENQPTEDGRILMPGSVTWRDGNLPLGLMLETPHGDFAEAPLCGAIDRLERIGDVIAAGGYFNDASPDETLAATARTAIAALESRSVSGISIDLMVLASDVIMWPLEELNPAGEDELPPAVDENMGVPVVVEEIVEVITGEPAGRMLAAVYEGVIGGACIVPVPAISNASIMLAATAGFFERIEVVSALFEDCGCDETETDIGVSLVAAAAPIAPPADWFADPQLEKPTPLTVLDDGRVFGHVAPWNTCHEGFPGRCVTAPRSRMQYAKFHNGPIQLADGSELRVGKLTLKAGHASTRISEAAAVAHYDNTASVAAFVRAGEDSHGIWVAGALKSDITPEMARDLKAHPLSGDWRNGEMVAAHAVVDPGFPVLRASGLGELLADEEDLVPVSPLEYLRPGAKTKAA